MFQPKVLKMEEYFCVFLILNTARMGQKIAIQPQAVDSEFP